jgi:hypothetical protein
VPRARGRTQAVVGFAVGTEAQVQAGGAVLRLHHGPPDKDHGRSSPITKAATTCA